jgi:hypothetical protein
MAWRWRSMKAVSSQPQHLTPAQRGQIVQRVIVDHWSTADAAAAAGVPEHLVAAWVADFRRHGMASLRRRPGTSATGDFVRRRILGPLRLALRAVAGGTLGLLAPQRPLPPLPIRRSQDDRGGS